MVVRRGAVLQRATHAEAVVASLLVRHELLQLTKLLLALATLEHVVLVVGVPRQCEYCVVTKDAEIRIARKNDTMGC